MRNAKRRSAPGFHDLDEMRNAVTAVGSSAHLINASAALAAACCSVDEIKQL
jgi:hypothetical protein